MLKKEIYAIVKNPVYYMLLFLPFLLSFFMSEGIKNYSTKDFVSLESINTTKEVILYSGTFLNAKIQFMVSELNFMIMMISTLIGLNVLEDRRLHIWDRVIDKDRFLLVKVFIHYIYSALMVIISLLLFKICFDITFPFKSVIIFLSFPLLSLSMGILAGIYIDNRTVLSNTLMMIVMLFGYLGGSLSLSSVLSTTKFMRYLMYVSPVTLGNKIIFLQILGIDNIGSYISFIAVIFVVLIISFIFIKRRLKNGSII